MKFTKDLFPLETSPLILREAMTAVLATLVIISLGLYFRGLGLISARAFFILIAAFALVNLLTIRLSFYLVRRREMRLQYHRQLLRALNQVSDVLISSLPVQEVLQATADQIAQAFDVRTVAMYVLDSKRQTLELPVVVGASAPLRQRLHEHPLAQRTLAENGPVINTLLADNEASAAPGAASVLFWAMSVPMAAGSNLLGAILVANHTPPRLPDELGEILQTLGRQLGTCLERAEAYQRLQAEQQSLAQRIADSADAIWVLDHNGHLLQFNQSANALTGYAAAAVIGQPWTDFVPLEQQANFQRMLDSVLGGDHQIWESGWRHRDGAWLLLELGATRLAGMATEPGVQLIARDVGARTAAQRMRSEFMAAVSHELRTPLSSVMGYAELLTTGMAGELTGEQTEYAGIILKNTQRMQRLVNDLLEVSKLEAGQLALTMETVDLSMLASGVVDALRPLLNADGMQIEVDLAPDLPAVHGDQPRLEQVLTNLLANASKYSPSGGLIRLVGYRHAPAADPLRLQLALPANASGWAIIAVIDQGMGIPPAEIPGLFHRFHRGQTARAQRVDGSGLGLYLARSIVEAHHGHVGVSSEVDKGSIFWVALPASG